MTRWRNNARHETMTRTACLVGLLVAISLPAVSPSAYAVEDKSVAGPLLDKASGSYFELRELKTAGSRNWSVAKAAAQEQSFKGRPGRLAVIRSPATHQFIVSNFPMKHQAWIGLRWLCGSKKLLWVDNTILEKGDFAAWNYELYGDPTITCLTSRINFMGAYYRPPNQLWSLQGEVKHYSYYIVEYPAGGSGERSDGETSSASKR